MTPFFRAGRARGYEKMGSLAKAGQHVGDGDRVHTRPGSAENLGKLSTVPNVLEPQLEQVWGEPQARAPGTGQGR